MWQKSRYDVVGGSFASVRTGEARLTQSAWEGRRQGCGLGRMLGQEQQATLTEGKEMNIGKFF